MKVDNLYLGVDNILLSLCLHLMHDPTRRRRMEGVDEHSRELALTSVWPQGDEACYAVIDEDML